MCLPTDKIASRFVRLEPTRATARTVVVCCALLLLLGFAGGSAAQAQAIEQKIAPCKGCHVTGTLQSNSMIPNIWGQSVGYVYIQLRDFKSGARNAPIDTVMRAIVAPMSDKDMLEIARYASSEPWPKVEPISMDSGLLKKGTYVAALGGCGGCHFNDWNGFSANPRIGGQSTAYLTSTMRQLRSGARANSPGMSDLMRTLDEAEIDAVAAYLNSR
jgi:cytochrome c553